MKMLAALLLLTSLPLIVLAATKVETSAPVKGAIASVSSGAANFLSPAFAVIDGARVKMVASLDAATVWTKAQIGTKVLNNSGFSVHTLFTICYTLVLYLLTIVTYLFANAIPFYITIVVLIVLLVRRRSY